MFDSQALTTAIGLSLLFFVLASGASAIVESLSRLLQKRAKDLEATLSAMLGGTAVAKDNSALAVLKGTAVFTSAQAAAQQARYITSSRARPAYLSARAFADAVTELLAGNQAMDGSGWAGLRKRLLTLEAEAEGDLLHVKAGLESWFDETMARLADAYKRWATAVLFVVGLLLAAVGNVSAIIVAQTLWLQPVVRQAAVNAAEQVAAKGTPSDASVGGDVKSVTDLTALGLPVGWPTPPKWGDLSWLVPHVGGWLMTALLLMLGAPFWFDALSRLVSLRTTGAKPPPATQDEASATSLRASTVSLSGTSVIDDAIRGLASSQDVAAAPAQAGPPDDEPPPQVP
jgi:hypothetical protein